MFHGSPPIDLEGLTIAAAAQRLLERDATRLPGGGDLPLIVGKALAKERERRYATAADLAADLRCLQRDEPVLARAPTTRYRVAKFVRRHRALVAGTAATILALAAGLVLALASARRAARVERRARHTAALPSMLAASAAADDGDVLAFRRHLAEVPDGERGWEWAYLEGRFHGAYASAPAPTMSNPARAVPSPRWNSRTSATGAS
jgi:hypothetical protein